MQSVQPFVPPTGNLIAGAVFRLYYNVLRKGEFHLFLRHRPQAWLQSSRQIAFLSVVLFGASLRAEEFHLLLELSQGNHHQATTNPVDPHELKPVSKRASMTVEADSKVTTAWKVTYIAKPPMNDVLVHFYVVKIERSGQAPPPLAPQRVLLESALTMDFANGTSTEAKLEARLRESGVYLVRLEAQGAGEASAAEMELVVK